jgi:hypothetical protein
VKSKCGSEFYVSRFVGVELSSIPLLEWKSGYSFTFFGNSTALATKIYLLKCGIRETIYHDTENALQLLAVFGDLLTV